MIKTVKTGGIEMEYFSFGSGDRDLVLLPGLSITSVMGVEDAVVQGYAVFTVYVPDRRKNLPAAYTVCEMAEDTVQVLREIGIREADFIGISQGGMMAQYIALEHPDMVHKLVLGSTAAAVRSDTGSTTGSWSRDAEEGNAEKLVADFMNRIYTPGFSNTFRDQFAHMASELTAEDLARFTVLAKAAEGFDVSERLGEIRCPVFAIGAENDAVCPPSCSVEIAEKTGGEVYIYPDYGHAVYDEAPDYRQRILDFLNK